MTISRICLTLSNSTSNSSICRSISWKRAISASAEAIVSPARTDCAVVEICVCAVSCCWGGVSFTPVRGVGFPPRGRVERGWLEWDGGVEDEGGVGRKQINFPPPPPPLLLSPRVCWVKQNKIKISHHTKLASREKMKVPRP